MREYRDKFGNKVRIIRILKHYFAKNNYYLLEQIETRQQFIVSEAEFRHEFMHVAPKLTTFEKIALYSAIFKGRLDVYAKSYFDEALANEFRAEIISRA